MNDAQPTPFPATADSARAPARRRNPLLAIAFAVSLALHGLLLAVHFRPPEARMQKDKGLEVVLVNVRHATPPEKAEVLAQANVDAGGTTEEPVRPKSPLPPQPARTEAEAVVEAKPRPQKPVREQKPVLTRDKAPAKVASAPKKVDKPAPPTPEPAPRGLDLLDSAAAVARLEAEIDRNLEQLAKRPRRKFIGARVQEYRFAQYVEDWRLKIERVGTLNYPEAARGKLYGSLMLSVSIRADGTVDSVGVRRSSGHKLLDDAAVRIVRLAAPFAPFPPDIRKDTDIIEITRTWTFTNRDQVRAQ